MADIDLSQLEILAKELQNYTKDIDKNVQRSLVVAANLIRNESIKSIDSRKSVGRSYKRGNVRHIASLKGFYPNTDTGNLKNSIRVKMNGTNVSVGSLQSMAPYGEYLEHPHSLDRPFLRNTLKSAESRINTLIREAIRRTT